MIVISPACSCDRITLRANVLAEVIRAIGTSGYGRACLDLFEEAFDAEHWALFRYGESNSVSCVATSSRMHAVAASENIDRFVSYCHRADPSLIALKQKRPEPTCVTKIEIGDIRDRQYRQCFEHACVHERLGFFSRLGSELYQLCIYRGTRKRGYSSPELVRFSTLASLVLTTALKHEERLSDVASYQPHLDLPAIERYLESLPGKLSKREREVCSRAAAGKTIEGTALDLDIRQTSVITYRQRAYQKLGISRQNELVALVNNLRAARYSGYASA